MQFPKTSGLIAVAALVAVPTIASANHIDFFVEGATSLTLTPGQTQQSQFATDPNGDSIIGSGRTTTIEFVPGAANGVITANLIGEGTRSGGSDQGQLVFSNSATTQGTLTLDYGTFSNFNVVNAPVNYNAFSVDVAAIEPDGSFTVTATAVDTDGDSSTVSSSLMLGENFLPYASFDSNVDFTSLDRLQFQVTAQTPGADITLNEITREVVGVVPEPVSLGLAGLAGLALIRRRR